MWFSVRVLRHLKRFGMTCFLAVNAVAIQHDNRMYQGRLDDFWHIFSRMVVLGFIIINLKQLIQQTVAQASK